MAEEHQGWRARIEPWRLVFGMWASAIVIIAALAAVEMQASAAVAAPAGPGPAREPAAAAAALPASPYDLAAATCPGLDPSILVAIHEVETLGSHTGTTSSAGAIGPMQFLPATWERYAVDANGDGVAAATDLPDALHGAAALLCANGGGDPTQLPNALWNYNHSWQYVWEVRMIAGHLPAGSA